MGLGFKKQLPEAAGRPSLASSRNLEATRRLVGKRVSPAAARGPATPARHAPASFLRPRDRRTAGRDLNKRDGQREASATLSAETEQPASRLTGRAAAASPLRRRGTEQPDDKQTRGPSCVPKTFTADPEMRSHAVFCPPRAGEASALPITARFHSPRRGLPHAPDPRLGVAAGLAGTRRSSRSSLPPGRHTWARAPT